MMLTVETIKGEEFEGNYFASVDQYLIKKNGLLVYLFIYLFVCVYMYLLTLLFLKSLHFASSQGLLYILKLRVPDRRQTNIATLVVKQLQIYKLKTASKSLYR